MLQHFEAVTHYSPLDPLWSGTIIGSTSTAVKCLSPGADGHVTQSLAQSGEVDDQHGARRHLLEDEDDALRIALHDDNRRKVIEPKRLRRQHRQKTRAAASVKEVSADTADRRAQSPIETR
jgi:hypothetical protein